MNTIEFLDALKSRYSLPSDYAIAKKLGVSTPTVSRWRNGKDFLGSEAAINVAKLLQIDPAYVFACVYAERAKQDDERAVWTSMIERLGGVAASLALGLGLSVTPAPADASSDLVNNSDSSNLYYVKQ